MAAGDLKVKYSTPSTAPTVTNLHSLASDQSLISGWTSLSVNNTSTCYEDFLYGFTFTTHASNRQAGVINIFVIGSINDTPLWPATASGTIGTEGLMAFVDTEERDTLCKAITSIVVDNTASAIYTFPQTGIAALFGGFIPTHHAIFITHNAATTTTAGLAAAGSAVYYTPVYRQYT